MKPHFLYLLLFTGLVFSCGKTTEVTIVESAGDVLPGEKTGSKENKTIVQDDFTKLTVGEANEIQTMDPLFAMSTSELRVNALIYDRITELDENGVAAPSVAKKWTVSRDSLRYTFTIRDNIFFHKDSRFTSGIGRQLIPKDIVSTFERMASNFVPDNAANLFQNIKGFQSYHSEQTFIKNPANRTIKSIEGISVENDSTIVFLLASKDSNFLEKLAHPLASIYPKESLLANRNPIYEPIGTGKFYLAQRKRNTLILASNDDYFKTLTLPTRVDIMHGIKEGDLFQDFAKGDLDVIIEISPETVSQVTDTSGNIDSIFSSVFQLIETEVTNQINLYYNEASNEQAIFSEVANHRNFLNFEKPLGSLSSKNNLVNSDTLANTTIYIAFTQNPSEVFLVNKTAEKLSTLGINVVMNSSYAVTDEVTFSTSNFSSATPALTWNYPVYILSKMNISGIKINAQAWNISFDGVNISSGQ